MNQKTAVKNKKQTLKSQKKTRKKQKYHKKAADQIAIANERIEELFKQASSVFNKDKALSNRYVMLARKISMKYKVRLPSELKRRMCKHCYSFLVPGKNSTIRLENHSISCLCKECNKKTYFPYIREQKKARMQKLCKTQNKK